MGRMARGQYRNQTRGLSLGLKTLGWWGCGLAALGLAAGTRPAQAQVTINPGGAFAATPGAFTVAPGAYGAPAPAAAVVEPAPSAAAPLEIPAVPPAWLITPVLTLGETFTDNANLSPAGSRVWDLITSVTPELDVAGQTGRLTVGLTYDPQELIFARSSPTTVLQQRLLGTGTAILWPDALFFDASASISQAFVRPTGPVGPTTLTTSNNLTTVYTTNASPYLRQHLGSYSDSESRYRFSTASTSGSGIAPEQIHELRQSFLGGDAFGRLGWELTGDFTRLNRLHEATDPLSGISSKDALVRADLTYPIYEALSATGGVGYERISDPTLSPPPRGVIWDAGLRYQPNQLVASSLTYGERFNTSDIEFNTTYNLDPQLRLSAIYTETIQTSLAQLAGATNQTTLAPGPDGTLVVVPAGTAGSATLNSSTFGISSGAFLTKTAELDATLAKERDTYSARVYETKEHGSNTATLDTTLAINAAAASFASGTAVVTAERIFGGSFTWNRQLWPDLTGTAGTSYYRSLFLDGSGRRDNTYTLSLALTYALSRTATTTISLLRSDLRSNITADSLVVDTVMATIRKQF